MKLVHHARDNFYGEEEIAVAAEKLLAKIGHEQWTRSTTQLLQVYRKLDRGF
jgi:hypothetical protein